MISRFKILISVDGKERWADADKVFAHLMQAYTKKQAKLQGNYKKRLEKFMSSVNEHDYDREMLVEFIDYWTEPNKSGTKMKFELEKTWSLSRRLKKWKRNGFSNKAEVDGRTKYEKYIHPVVNEEDIASPEEIKEILSHNNKKEKK